MGVGLLLSACVYTGTAVMVADTQGCVCLIPLLSDDFQKEPRACSGGLQVHRAYLAVFPCSCRLCTRRSLLMAAPCSQRWICLALSVPTGIPKERAFQWCCPAGRHRSAGSLCQQWFCILSSVLCILMSFEMLVQNMLFPFGVSFCFL